MVQKGQGLGEVIITASGNEISFQDVAGSVSPAALGEMYIRENSTPIVIVGSLQIYGARLFSAGDLEGWTFEAGSTGSITAFADAGGGQVTVTAANSLSNGDIVTITGTTNYNGPFVVSNVSGSDFEITDTWVSNDATGTFDQPSTLTAGASAAGSYKVDCSISVSKEAGSAATGHFHVYINASESVKAHTNRRFTTNDVGAFPLSGGLTIIAGDKVWFAVENITGTDDFTLENANFYISRKKD